MWAKLPTGEIIDYVIDGQERRIAKKVNGNLQKGYLYRNALQVVAQLDAFGNVESRFVYGSSNWNNVPTFMIKGGSLYRIVSDQVGSPRVVVHASSGAIVQQIEYDEFGNVLSDTNPGFQPFGFAGGLYDADVGIVRFGHRDYDPVAGRWTAKDPLLFEGGLANLYGYVLNDPINFVDPEGLVSAKRDHQVVRRKDCQAKATQKGTRRLPV